MTDPFVVDYLLDVVPSPPDFPVEPEYFVNWMRWLNAVMDRDCEWQLIFVASLYADCIENDWLPKSKQERILRKFIRDTFLQYTSGALEIQMGVPNDSVKH